MVHEGHRERLKRQFLEQGLDGFTDIQALELALFYCIPRRDTNPIAHALLDRFGSLPKVLEAPIEELMKVPGVGEHAAAFLRLITDLGRYYAVRRSTQGEVLPTLEQCAGYLVPRFFGRQEELVYLLCLDAGCKVLGCRKVGEGSVNSAGISVRKVVELALATKASSVILAHNHPGGLAAPSPEDIQTTRRMAAALASVEVTLVDHVVVAGDGYASMALSGVAFGEVME